MATETTFIIFTSPHCGACIAAKPSLQLAVNAGAACVDPHDDNWALADEYGVFGIPTIVAVGVDGTVTSRLVGMQSKRKTQEWINAAR